MAGLRRLGVALVLLSLASCGRSTGQEALPAMQPLEVQTVSAEGASATASIIDMGGTLELTLNGQGFAGTGAYAVQPLTSYAPGPTPTSSRADDALPEAMPVYDGNRVQLVTTFQGRGGDRPWVGFGVFFHPDGNLDNEGGSRLVLFVPLPAALR